MRFTELDENQHSDYFHDCSKNLNNSLAHWVSFAAIYWDVDLTDMEARQQRARCRADEDRADRYHTGLRNDGPWF